MHAAAINLLREIEERCDTGALQYRGVSYWPLCRLRLWSALMRSTVLARKEGDPANVTNSAPTWPDVGQVNAEIFGPASPGLLRAGSDPARTFQTDNALNPDALFFVRPEEYSDNVNSLAFAKIIDSVVEVARETYTATKVELADPRVMGFKRHFPSLFLHLGHAGQDVKFDPPGKLENFAALSEALDQSGADVNLDPDDLMQTMGKIFYFARIFEKLLKALSPHSLFLSVYYHPVGMAWALACRWAGVTSVDLQHGRLGPHHGAYTQLTAAPEDGYHLMPDLVWCWGAQTKHDIEVDKNPRCKRHGGIIGGNAWLNKWRYGDTEGLEPPEVAQFANETAEKLKILVSLQPLDSPVNAALLEAMKQSPPEWLWLLRLHPLRRHTAPEIAKLLSEAGVQNFEIEQSTSLPLFSLLKMADHHVTVFSSVVVEAAAFGVRTSLIGAEGRDIFMPQIEQEVCKFTPRAQDLIEHISQTISGAPQPVSDPFIHMGKHLAAQSIATIQKSAANSRIV